jgi:hypothetical protein
MAHAIPVGTKYANAASGNPQNGLRWNCFATIAPTKEIDTAAAKPIHGNTTTRSWPLPVQR